MRRIANFTAKKVYLLKRLAITQKRMKVENF